MRTTIFAIAAAMAIAACNGTEATNGAALNVDEDTHPDTTSLEANVMADNAMDNPADASSPSPDFEPTDASPGDRDATTVPSRRPKQ